MDSNDEFSEYVPKKSKLAYGVLTGSSVILSGIAFSAITFYYNVKLGLSAQLIGIAWLLFAIWNTINDPIFGYLEDRTKSEKYGRRIPYIRFGAPFFGILFILCWFPLVDLSNDFWLFLNLLIVLLLFDTIFTIIGLINFSLPAEMGITQKVRAQIVAYGAVFTSLGFIVSFILPVYLLTGDKSAKINPLFLITMVLIGIICSVIIFVSSFFLKENLYTQLEESLGFIDGIKQTLKNKPFLKYEFSNFSFLLAQTIFTTGIFYYIDFVLGLSGFLTIIPLLLVFLMVFVFTPIFSKLAGKYGLKKVYIFGLLFTGSISVLLFLLGWSLLAAVIPFLLLGIGFSAIILLRPAVAADIIDFDETITGKRRETSYAGMNAVIEKPAVSIGNWIFLSLITYFGFQQNIQTQSFNAKLGIMIAFTLIPAAFVLFSSIVMFFYPLDGPEWNKQKLNLGRIHEEKEKNYIQYLREHGKI
ncbi:MAG: MFS transporter [Promethearchaeota archaeon]|nr:MAG: MFS transporter [Candidatus Lokiarchaeota archaeon]